MIGYHASATRKINCFRNIKEARNISNIQIKSTKFTWFGNILTSSDREKASLTRTLSKNPKPKYTISFLSPKINQEKPLFNYSTMWHTTTCESIQYIYTLWIRFKPIITDFIATTNFRCGKSLLQRNESYYNKFIFYYYFFFFVINFFSCSVCHIT